jgi:hypothetical protein
MTDIERDRRMFSTVEKVLIALQVLLALGFGLFGMLQANDPDWGDLQRVVIFMMVAMWLGGIVGSVLVARLVNPKLARIAILVIGPFTVFLLFIGWSLVANG